MYCYPFIFQPITLGRIAGGLEPISGNTADQAGEHPWQNASPGGPTQKDTGVTFLEAANPLPSLLDKLLIYLFCCIVFMYVHHVGEIVGFVCLNGDFLIF